MITLTSFGILAVLQLAASSTQNPPLKQCTGQKNPVIQVQSVSIRNAELGKTVKVDTTVVVHEAFGTNPVLQMTYAKLGGGNLTCFPDILPCDLKLCGGTSRQEKQLTREWNNKCPIAPGEYTAYISLHVPDTDAARVYVGDGYLNVTLKIVDNDKIEECVSFPVSIKVD